MYLTIKLWLLWGIIPVSLVFSFVSDFYSKSQVCQVPNQTMGVSQVLSDDEKRAFIRDGFVVLRAAVPPDMVEAALKVVDNAYAEGKYEFDETKADAVPRFHDDVMSHSDLGEILERTKIFVAAEDLVGAGKALYAKKAQIAFRPKDKTLIEKGMGMSELIPWYRYHIDGGTGKLAATGTPFTLLIGVCLSPGQDIDENRGQFTAWPSSHFKLHRIVRQRWQDKLISGHTIFGAHGIKKPRIGQPIRVLLKPGDAVLAHQRLGHSGGINLHDDVRKNLYFRVRHRSHPDIVEDMLNGSVFFEYEGLHEMADEIAKAEIDAEAIDDEESCKVGG